MLWGCATAPPPAPVYEAATWSRYLGLAHGAGRGRPLVVAYTGTKGMSRGHGGAVCTASSGGIHRGVRPGMVCGHHHQDRTMCSSLVEGRFEEPAVAGASWVEPAGAAPEQGVQAIRPVAGHRGCATSGGASTGGFGGGAPPTQVLERWSRRRSPDRHRHPDGHEASRPSSPGSTKRRRFFPRRPRPRPREDIPAHSKTDSVAAGAACTCRGRSSLPCKSSAYALWEEALPDG